ncbi:urease accessory protein UreD [Pseudenhygromyxa sp. WMMC2535]|uniref:urease accessory protein UreD n=1 Tax=Pseudenhygromyxa sp. WMMC2535 TaxID=2712867 RepID=UPI0015954452|nr:urease accessory protein UreD [Pseudenhygromyxa sp. WMMC2535]NVB37524.1 urease accessory protein UreD [Pseudenhygromyxa sp. WMMC2535]
MSPPPDEGWLAQLDLRFVARGGRSVMTRSRHFGPLRVQRPFYPEGPAGPCHVYMLHPPGGVVGSDRLELTLRAGPGSQALLTTPGAGKLYRTRGPLATISQRVVAAAGAYVELLPQETIAFRGADALLDTTIELETGARAVGWDIVCLGRPAAGERFDAGRLRQRIELRVDGALRWLERADYRGGSALLDAPWGLHGRPVIGTMWCAPAEEAELELARRACAALETEDTADTAGATRIAFTRIRGVLVGRCLAASTAAVRDRFERAWLALRAHTGLQGVARPRVWNT